MLKRIVILNSATYGKAIVRLDDCDSIQLAGPNRVGKSTFIFALNFLFIIDGKKMTFVGDKPGDKETIHHYFPSPIDSYIIFEIFKFCDSFSAYIFQFTKVEGKGIYFFNNFF